MSTQNSQSVSRFTSQFTNWFAKHFTQFIAFIIASTLHVSVKAWELDLSRRSKDFNKSPSSSRLKLSQPAKKEWVQDVIPSLEPTQDVVILNTVTGFVPETIRMKMGQSYRIHIVNVNDQEKNVSFVLDAFSEHHGTYFGQQKSFTVSPRQEGVFGFVCPETSRQGKIIVLPATNKSEATRQTASSPND